MGVNGVIGERVGVNVGDLDGDLVGRRVGDLVGRRVGCLVGEAVGAGPVHPHRVEYTVAQVITVGEPTVVGVPKLPPNPRGLGVFLDHDAIVGEPPLHTEFAMPLVSAPLHHLPAGDGVVGIENGLLAAANCP